MKIARMSPFSGKLNIMDLPIDTAERMEAYASWITGDGLIQNKMPWLNAGEREFLITGITPEEWDKTFK